MQRLLSPLAIGEQMDSIQRHCHVTCQRGKIFPFRLRWNPHSFITKCAHPHTAQMLVKQNNRDIHDGSIAQLCHNFFIGPLVHARIFDHHDLFGFGNLLEHLVIGDDKRGGSFLRHNRI